MEFVDFLLQALVWYFIFRVVWWLVSAWNQAKQEVHEKTIEVFNAITHRVKIENHNGQTYWYDVDNAMFLAQGATTDEIIEKLKVTYSTHFFFLEGDEDTVYRVSAPDWNLTPHNIN